MSLTITERPDAYGLVKDEHQYTIQSSDYLQTVGVNAYLKIDVTGLSSLNDQFSLSVNGITQTFTFRSTDLEDGLSIVTGSVPGGQVAAEWQAIKIAEALLKNYYLTRYFNIAGGAQLGGGYGVTLTAKEVGSAYSLTLTESLNFMSEDTNIAGVNQAIKSNYEIIFRLLFEQVFNSNQFTELVEIPIPVDQQGAATLEIRKFIESFLTTDKGAFAAAVPTQVYPFKRFYLQMTETYGLTQQPYAINTDQGNTISMAMGGTSKQFRANSTFEATYKTGNKFLTLLPDAFTITAQENSWLSFLFNATNAYSFQVKCYLNDGTTVDWQPVFSGNYQANSVYSFPIGLSVLQAAIDPWPDCYKIGVRIYNDSTSSVTSEEKTIYLDHTYHEQETSFVFHNSLGVAENLHCTGLSTDQHTGSFSSFTAELDNSHAVDRFQAKNYSQFSKSKFITNSGNRKRAEMEQLVDFFNAPEQYVVLNNELHAIKLVKYPKIDLSKTRVPVYNVAFEWEFSQLNEAPVVV